MRYVWTMLAVAFLGVVLLSCGTRDDRNEIRAQYGEPESIRRTTVDPFWTETWLYNTQGVAFEFRRTSGCGTKRDVYLNVTYPLGANAAAHLPKTTAPRDSLENFSRPLSPVAPR